MSMKQKSVAITFAYFEWHLSYLVASSTFHPYSYMYIIWRVIDCVCVLCAQKINIVRFEESYFKYNSWLLKFIWNTNEHYFAISSS